MRALPSALLYVALACSPHERVPIGHDERVAGAGGQSGGAGCELAAIDPAQLTLLGPSDRSHWLQPWRAYRDTWPVQRMAAAPGYQTPFPPNPTWAPYFSAAGFKRVTLEVGWARQSFDAPDRLTPEVQSALEALAEQAQIAGLRPILLLNAPGASLPSQQISLDLAEPADAGARTVRFSPADAARLSVHKALIGPAATPSLISRLAADGVAELARPLSQALEAGPVAISQLRYAPFSRPSLASGEPNPEYEETLAGWLAYLSVVSSALREALGTQRFDVELWNETSIGNNFEVFDINALYDPPLETDRSASFEENLNAIRERSASWLRASERNLGEIGIVDGSGNMRFSVTADSEPAGISALARHVSAQGKRFPEDAALGKTPSVDALGQPNGELTGENWQEAFTPEYGALFPEQSLTALYPPDSRRPAQIVRDLAPFDSVDARGIAHRRAPLVAGVPTPDVWLTAASMNLGVAEALGLSLTRQDRLHVQAKALLRLFSGYVGAGVGMISIYGPDLDTVRYFDLDEPGGGAALLALGRFFERFEAAAASEPRELEVLGVASCAPGRQFQGDGSAAHPDLEHRQLVAVFPFQSGPRSFVAPAYVMTRNLLQERTAAGDATRFDMPPERFELRLRGLAAASARVTAYDPLLDTALDVPIVERNGEELVIAVWLPDYPLLLQLED